MKAPREQGHGERTSQMEKAQKIMLQEESRPTRGKGCGAG